MKKKNKFLGIFCSAVLCAGAMFSCVVNPIKNIFADDQIVVTKVAGQDNVYTDGTNKYKKAYTGVNEIIYNSVIVNPGLGISWQALVKSYKYDNGNLIDWGKEAYYKYEPIEWQIVNINDGKAMLVSDRALANMPFQPTYDSDGYTAANGAPDKTPANTYQYSNLRYWLNGMEQTNQTGVNNDTNLQQLGLPSTLTYPTSFMSAFTADEIKNILPISIANQNNVTSYTQDANGDKIFLLSIEDLIGDTSLLDDGYIQNKAYHIKASDYAKSQGAGDQSSANESYSAYCWTRTSSSISYGGRSFGTGESAFYPTVDQFYICVVPAMFVDATTKIFENKAVGDKVEIGMWPQHVAVNVVESDSGTTPNTGVNLNLMGLYVSLTACGLVGVAVLGNKKKEQR